MRHRVSWMLALLAMPGVAIAHSATGFAAERVPPAAGPGIERAEPSAAASGLDLQLDPRELPAPSPPVGSRAIATNPGNRDTPAQPLSTDRGLSFGVEVTPRGSVNNLARMSEADQPGVQDNVERFIEHSTVGLRGRYRF